MRMTDGLLEKRSEVIDFSKRFDDGAANSLYEVVKDSIGPTKEEILNRYNKLLDKGIFGQLSNIQIFALLLMVIFYEKNGNLNLRRSTSIPIRFSQILPKTFSDIALQLNIKSSNTYSFPDYDGYIQKFLETNPRNTI